MRCYNQINLLWLIIICYVFQKGESRCGSMRVCGGGGGKRVLGERMSRLRSSLRIIELTDSSAAGEPLN